MEEEEEEEEEEAPIEPRCFDSRARFRSFFWTSLSALSASYCNLTLPLLHPRMEEEEEEEEEESNLINLKR